MLCAIWHRIFQLNEHVFFINVLDSLKVSYKAFQIQSRKSVKINFKFYIIVHNKFLIMIGCLKGYKASFVRIAWLRDI